MSPIRFFVTLVFSRNPIYVAFMACLRGLLVSGDSVARLQSETDRRGSLVKPTDVQSSWDEQAQCGMPKCGHPRSRETPDVMIPFWQQDLCKLWYTARSIVLHDRSGYLGKIFLVWVSIHPASKYQEQVNAIVGTLKENHDVEVIDFSGQVSALGKGMGGWYAQQVLKLKIASKITSEFYIVMDAKNTIVRDIRADEFITRCNQGLIFGRYRHDQIPSPHWEWYASSAQALGVEAPKAGYWPPSITPMVIHRPTVLQMLASMKENSSLNEICEGPLCAVLGAGTSTGKGASEFTLYLLYATSQDPSNCIHDVIIPRSHGLEERWAVSLWRGEGNSEQNLRRCNLAAHAKGTKLPLMFGAQTSSLDDLTDAQADQATGQIAAVYERAGLHDSSVSREFLMNCVVGRRGVPPPVPPSVPLPQIGSAGGRPEAQAQVTDFCCIAADNNSDFCATCLPEAREMAGVGWCGNSDDHCADCGFTWCERRHEQRIRNHTLRPLHVSVSTTKPLSHSEVRARTWVEEGSGPILVWSSASIVLVICFLVIGTLRFHHRSFQDSGTRRRQLSCKMWDMLSGRSQRPEELEPWFFRSGLEDEVHHSL